jgi:acyltransferase
MRLGWIDYLKAVGIFLVVYGHTMGVLPPLEKWIYSFHMPLFFLVSGFLMKPERLHHGFKTFFTRATKSIMVPYIIFSLICYLFWLVIMRNMGTDAGEVTSVISPLLAILYGTASSDAIQLIPIVLWFFPCLYIAHFMTYIVFKSKKIYVSIVLSGVLVVIGLLIPRNIALPFELEDALVAQAFIMLGFLAKKKAIVDYIFKHKPYIWAVILLVFGTFIAHLNCRVDMRSSWYGNFGYFFCSSISITLGLAALFSKLPRCRLPELISNNTIIIFPLHFLVYSCFNGIYVYVFHDITIRAWASVSFVSAIVNILLIISVSPIIKKVLPWAYGEKKVKG